MKLVTARNSGRNLESISSIIKTVPTTQYPRVKSSSIRDTFTTKIFDPEKQEYYIVDWLPISTTIELHNRKPKPRKKKSK